MNIKIWNIHYNVEKYYILCGLNVPEKLKVSHWKLGSDLHGAELQERDMTLSEEVLGVLIWTQCLRLHVVLQVVPTEKKRG